MQSKSDTSASVIAQQRVKNPSIPAYSPTTAMKPEVMVAVNPDPLLFVFCAVDSAVGAQHSGVCPGGFERTFG